MVRNPVFRNDEDEPDDDEFRPDAASRGDDERFVHLPEQRLVQYSMQRLAS